MRSDDDSDADGDEGINGKPKRKSGGGFQKPFNLSYPLQELTGETQVGHPLAPYTYLFYANEHMFSYPAHR